MKNDSTTFAEFMPVLATHNAGDRVFVKSILDAERIVYYIRGETVAPYLFHSLPMTVMVRKDHVEKARKILKDVTLSYSYGGRKKKPAGSV